MVVVAALLGVLFSAAPAVVFMIILATAALPLLNARPAVWIGLSIAVPWLSRLLTVPGFAPRVLDFLDFPLVLIAFVLSVVGFLASGKLLSGATRSICLATGAVAVVMALSWGFNDRAEPMRLAAGLVLALEPFLLLLAVILAPMTRREVKRLTQASSRSSSSSCRLRSSPSGSVTRSTTSRARSSRPAPGTTSPRVAWPSASSCSSLCACASSSCPSSASARSS